MQSSREWERCWQDLFRALPNNPLRALCASARDRLRVSASYPLQGSVWNIDDVSIGKAIGSSQTRSAPAETFLGDSIAVEFLGSSHLRLGRGAKFAGIRSETGDERDGQRDHEDQGHIEEIGHPGQWILVVSLIPQPPSIQRRTRRVV